MSQNQLGWKSATTLNTTTLTTSTTSRKPVPQRGCSRLARRTDGTSSGQPDSNALIVLCSAPWYWKTRRTSGSSAIARQVAEDEADPDHALDQHEEEAPAAVHREAGEQQRQAEEQAEREDAGDRDRAGDLLLADLDVLAAGVHVGRPDQRLHAEVQLLADQREAADERQLPERVDVDRRLQLAAVDDDLLGGGQAHGHRVVALAAHHHALDDGLAAIEERLLWLGADGLPEQSRLRSGYLRERPSSSGS